jgi:hypothetical protein
MSLYDPERDPVRRAGRWLRWGLRWVAVPAVLGVLVSANIDVRALPVVGAERKTAVVFLDGQAYFGHLDDSGESGTLVLRDGYYLQDAKGAPTNLAVTLVKRGTEVHEPADGMRINRDKVLAVERVGDGSAVASAIEVEREMNGAAPPLLSLNRPVIAGQDALVAQRTAAEHAMARAYAANVDTLAKLNDLVLPVSKAQAESITQKAVTDLRTVRINAFAALGTITGMTEAGASAYARAADARVEGQSYANEPGVLLAPDLNAVVVRAADLYGQIIDAASKQLTQPAPSPSPSASPRP